MTKLDMYCQIVGASGFRTVDAGDFKESDHPRDEGGKFTSGGGGGAKGGSESPAKASASTTKTNNEGYGEIQKMTGASETSIRDYLESRHGSHLSDFLESNPSKAELEAYIKKDFKTFVKNYDPADYGSESPAKAPATPSPSQVSRMSTEQKKAEFSRLTKEGYSTSEAMKMAQLAPGNGTEAFKKEAASAKLDAENAATREAEAGNRKVSELYKRASQNFGAAEYWMGEADEEDRVGNHERAERYRQDSTGYMKEGEEFLRRVREHRALAEREKETGKRLS